MTVSAYFTKLKELWDEHSIIAPLPTCKCSTSQEYLKMVQQQRLFQFLMGLNDSYQHARSQILLMSPLPSVHHAYSMISQEEDQHVVYSQHQGNPIEPTTLNMRGGHMNQGRGRGRSQDECSHCH